SWYTTAVSLPPPVWPLAAFRISLAIDWSGDFLREAILSGLLSAPDPPPDEDEHPAAPATSHAAPATGPSSAPTRRRPAAGRAERPAETAVPTAAEPDPASSHGDSDNEEPSLHAQGLGRCCACPADPRASGAGRRENGAQPDLVRFPVKITQSNRP